MKRQSIELDNRRLLFLPGDQDETLTFSAENWLEIAAESITNHGFFSVALSGGSTPKKIFKRLTNKSDVIDWTKVYLFWSDERSVPPTSVDSNYRMAMYDGGLNHLSIPKNQIFRMVTETDIAANAAAYEALIQDKLGSHPFDLVMLGMGDDGHTASLFPNTSALYSEERWVVANYIPQLKTWRMSLTYSCINRARHICLYVIGANKVEILEKVLISKFDFEKYPSQNIGTESNPALWIVDNAASQNLLSHLKS